MPYHLSQTSGCFSLLGHPVFLPRPDASFPSDWVSTLTHSHHLRGKERPVGEVNRLLVDWCRAHRIRAFGLGSPWEPVTAAAVEKYETTEREAYDAGRVDLQALRFEPEVRAHLADLNRLSNGDTLFYLDNETPKARYGHLWWLNWHFELPAWHDYSQDRPVQYYRNDPQREWNPLAGRPFRRRPYLEILRHQRAHQALGIWAHPTSWWKHHRDFVTNIAAEAGLHLLAHGFLDGLVVMGYDVFQPAYQALWFDWLDTGAVIPGFAESDQSNSQLDQDVLHPLMTTLVHCPQELTLASLTRAGRQGRLMPSTGGFADIHTCSTAMGGIHTLPPGASVEVFVDLHPPPGQSCFSRVEILGRGGQLLHSLFHVPSGQLRFRVTGGDHPAYLLVRAFGEHDRGAPQSASPVEHLTLSNPLYLHPPGFRFHTARTHLTLRPAPDSPFRNQPYHILSLDNRILDTACLDQTRHHDIPADAALHFPGLQQPWPLYPCMENPPVQDLLAYLWQGLFLRDFPDCRPGDVPPEAWRLDDLRQALSEQTLAL